MMQQGFARRRMPETQQVLQQAPALYRLRSRPPSSLYDDSRTCCPFLGGIRTRLQVQVHE
jgi:hypothetical protein